MKALLDQNLSFRLVDLFSDRFPGSGHVRDYGLTGDDDERIWSLAKDRGFFIVTKDSDFLALIHAAGDGSIPPGQRGHLTRARVAARHGVSAGATDERTRPAVPSSCCTHRRTSMPEAP